MFYLDHSVNVSCGQILTTEINSESCSLLSKKDEKGKCYLEKINAGMSFYNTLKAKTDIVFGSTYYCFALV